MCVFSQNKFKIKIRGKMRSARSNNSPTKKFTPAPPSSSSRGNTDTFHLTTAAATAISTTSIIASGRRKHAGGGSGPGGMRTMMASARGILLGLNQQQQQQKQQQKFNRLDWNMEEQHDREQQQQMGANVDNNNNNACSTRGGDDGFTTGSSSNALSGLHLSIRYTLPRVAVNSTFSGTIAAMHGYSQPSRAQVTRDAGALYTCFARREPTIGVNNRTEVICAGTSIGTVVLWRYRLSQRLQGVPPPANTINPPLVLGSNHRAAVTSIAFYAFHRSEFTTMQRRDATFENDDLKRNEERER